MSRMIEVSFPGGKKIDAKIGNTLIPTDQSIKNGGEALAPEPFQLFLASLVTCAGIYALEFCQTRNLSIEGMSLTMECTFDPEKKQYGKMDIHLKLPEGFPETHRDAIVRAMDLCPVKKHMIDEPEFTVRAT